MAARNNTIGIAIGPSQNGGSGGTFSGSVINSGGITAIGGFVRGLDANGNHIAGRPILPDFAPGIGIEVQETVTGSIVNTGTGGFANEIFGGNFGNGTAALRPFANQIPFQSVPGAIDVNAPVLGGIKNAGFISATSAVAIHSTAAIPAASPIRDISALTLRRSVRSG